MKRIVSSLLVIVILLTSLFVLAGCGSSEENGVDKSVKKYYENAEKCVLNDKWNGLRLTFAYPKDKGYETKFTDKKVEYQRVVLSSEDLNSEITIDFKNVASNDIEKRKEEYDKDTEQYSGFEEIEYAGYKGCVVNSTNWSGTSKIGVLMLTEVEEGKESEKGWYAIEFQIEKESTSSSAPEFDAAAYYQSEDFQNLLNSIQFERLDPVEVDGVLGADRYLVVKTLTPPSDEYEVYQGPDTNGVMSSYMLKDGKYNGSGAYFRIYSASNIDQEKFGTLDKVLEYYQGGSWNYTFTDSTLAGTLPVKVEHKPKDTSHAEKYSVWESGYFEKDGAVYNYLYYRYEDVPEAIGTKLIQEVLSGISFCNEE